MTKATTSHAIESVLAHGKSGVDGEIPFLGLLKELISTLMPVMRNQDHQR